MVRQSRQPKPSLPGFLFNIGKDMLTGGVNSLMQDVVRGGQDRVKKGIRSGMKADFSQGIAGIGGIGKATSDWPGWFNQVLMRDGIILPIIGARDFGKTTCAIVIAEHIQRKKGGSTMIYFPGYPQNYAPPHIVALPISAIPQLMDSVEPGAIVIFDDAYRFFSSYRTQSNTGLMFQDWVNGIAHQGVTIILTVQDSSDLHKAGLRADAFMFKPPERMFEGSERPQMRPIVKRVSEAFDSIPRADWVKHAFIYADPERQAMITYERPPWMTRSKAKYRGSQRGHALSNSEQGVGKSPVTSPRKGQYNPFDADL